MENDEICFILQYLLKDSNYAQRSRPWSSVEIELKLYPIWDAILSYGKLTSLTTW